MKSEKKLKRPETETSMVATTRAGWETLANSKYYLFLDPYFKRMYPCSVPAREVDNQSRRTLGLHDEDMS